MYPLIKADERICDSHIFVKFKETVHGLKTNDVQDENLIKNITGVVGPKFSSSVSRDILFYTEMNVKRRSNVGQFKEKKD